MSSAIPTWKAALRRSRDFIALGLALTALTVSSSAQEKKEAAAKITFQDHVFPIFEDQCLNCHNPDETKGGLDLSSYSATMAGGSSGEVVNPGDPSASRVVLTVTHREEPYMPPKKPILSKDRIDLISQWIESGLLEHNGSVAKKKKTGDFEMALDGAPDGKPEGPPPMPEHLRLEPYVVASGSSAVADVTTSPWAPLAAVTGQKQVLLYHTENHRLLGILPYTAGFPESVTFSRNGSLVVVGGGLGGKTGKVHAFDVKTGQKVIDLGSEFDSVLAADISPDHSQIALGGPGRNLKLYDTKTGEQLHSIKKHPDWLLHLAYSPDGKFLASGGRSGALYLWDPAKGLEYFTLKGPQTPITGLSWRADSKLLATTSEDGKLSLWETKEGKQIKAWDAHPGGALSVHFANDGKTIVSSGRDKTVKVWDTNGKNLRTIKDFPDLVLHATYSHDGKRIIAADWLGGITTWNAADGKKIASLSANPPSITSRIAWHQKRAPELRAELEKAKAAQQQAAKKQADHNASIAAAKKSVGDLQKQKQAADKLVAQLPGSIKKLTDESNKLKSTVAAREKQLADLGGQLKQAQQLHASVKAELDKWRQRLQAEQKAATPPGPNKTAALMARAVLVVDNNAEPKKPAPAPKPTTQPKPAPKTATPAPAPKPEPKKVTPSPAPKTAPKKEASTPKPAPKPQPSPKQKVDQLTKQLKDAGTKLSQLKSADAKLRQELAAGIPQRDAKLKELQAMQKQLEDTKKRIAGLPSKIKAAQEQQKKLEEGAKAVTDAATAAQAKVASLTRSIPANDRDLVFWKAEQFHLDVLAERDRLEEMKFELPETPNDEQKASVEYQEKKVASLTKQYLGMLPK